MVTTGAISHTMLQSNRHHQQTNTQFLYRPDALPVAQPTVSQHWREGAVMSRWRALGVLNSSVDSTSAQTSHTHLHNVQVLMFNDRLTTQAHSHSVHTWVLSVTVVHRPRSMILSTMLVLPLASSSLPAVIQICRSVGMCSRALFSTLRAFS